MVLTDESKSRQITVGGDPRITHCGAFLRRWKLDELPQLIDVFLGDMSLVGPRPEVPQYVALYPNESRRLILSVKPGITDLASIQYKDENELLARAEDPEREYIDTVLPAKIRFYEDYARNHCLWTDMVIVGKTLQALFE
jgi:lipopolysaccharide/colanic/teichoic acid biosynthesis glycosyltransferase